MAMEVCSDNCSIFAISPRISFSHDLNQIDDLPIENQHKLHYNNNPFDKSDIFLDSNSEFAFDFSIKDESAKLELFSSADELFSNGKILPIQVKKQVEFTKSKSTIGRIQNEGKQSSLKELLENSSEEQSSRNHNHNHPFSKQFWKFKRSNSLNCENFSGNNKGLIRSLSFLSRSKSTGSVNNLMKNDQKQREKTPVTGSGSNGHYYPYRSMKRNDNQKRCYYGNGVRISPVLNLPPRNFCKGSVGFFGFGLLFCNGKDKKKNKKK